MLRVCLRPLHADLGQPDAVAAVPTRLPQAHPPGPFPPQASAGVRGTGGGKDRETGSVQEACHRSRGLYLSTRRHARPRPRWGGPSSRTRAALRRGQGCSGWNLASGKDTSPGAPQQAPLRYPGRHD